MNEENDIKKAEEKARKLEISGRLKKVFKYKGVQKAVDLTELFGFNHTTATNYFTKDRVPTADNLMLICNVYKDINVRWILTGEGLMRRDESKGDVEVSAFPKEEILAYLNNNREDFKELSLTRKVFDAMYLDEWMEDLKSEKEKIRLEYERVYGPLS